MQAPLIRATDTRLARAIFAKIIIPRGRLR